MALSGATHVMWLVPAGLSLALLVSTDEAAHPVDGFLA